MSQILLGTANVSVLIICLVGMQACYFRGNRKWFLLLLICVILSGASASYLFYGWYDSDSAAQPRLDRSLPSAL